MTTRQVYSCNFCNATVDATSARGLKWTLGGLEWSPLHETATHVCDRCAKAIYELFQRTPSLNETETLPQKD